MTLRGTALRALHFCLAPIDPVRLDTFRVAISISLLCYMVAWFRDAAEWLTPVGFHLSTTAAGAYAPVAPTIPTAALPAFAVVLFGSIAAVTLGWQLAWTTPLVFLLVTYVTYVDPLSAFTLNRLYMASFAILCCGPLGAFWSLGGRRASPQSGWRVRILQATLLIQYGTAGWCKLVHGDWLRDSYVLWGQAQGWYRTDAAGWILENLPMGIWPAMQWGGLFFELLSPVLFGVRRLRGIAFVWGAAFQLSIALLMHQLIYFSLQMLCFYLLFADDATLHRLRARLMSEGDEAQAAPAAV